MPHGDDEQLKAEHGFWNNCFDSLRHALAHFSSINYDEGTFHNRKWAILSVAHAAEVFCNLILAKFDSTHLHGHRYPPLSKAIVQLREHPAFGTLRRSEQHIIRDILPQLSELRNVL